MHKVPKSFCRRIKMDSQSFVLQVSGLLGCRVIVQRVGLAMFSKESSSWCIHIYIQCL